LVLPFDAAVVRRIVNAALKCILFSRFEKSLFFIL